MLKKSSIRKAKTNDLSQICFIYNQSIGKNTATADMQPWTQRSQKDWHSKRNYSRHPIFVMSNNDEKILSWAALNAFKPRCAFDGCAEISIYVDENASGQGIGSAMVKHCEKFAVNAKLHSLVALIFTHNDASMHLFKNKFSYQEWGLLPSIAQFPERAADLVILGKKI